jgi:hypothetical protein
MGCILMGVMMRSAFLGACLLLAACGVDTVEFTDPCTNEIVLGDDLGVMLSEDGDSCTRARVGKRQYCLYVGGAMPLGWRCDERSAEKSAPTGSAKVKALVAGPYASASKACRERGGGLIDPYDADQNARVREAAEQIGNSVPIAWARFTTDHQSIHLVTASGETHLLFRAHDKKQFAKVLESTSVYWECSLTQAQLAAAPFPVVRPSASAPDGKTP